MAIATDDLIVINGDTYGPTTSRHQSIVRSAINAYSDLKSIILPYSAMNLAIDSVTNGRRQNRSAYELHRTFSGLKVIDEGEEIQKYGCNTCDTELTYGEYETHYQDYNRHSTWQRHLLAPSVFRLTIDWVEDIKTDRTETFEGSDREYVVYDHVPRHAVAYFLSGFDETARAWNGGYFLSRLPHKPKDIDHAFEMLKPEPVKRAIAKGITVKRQGDIFYIADEKMTTRKLTRKGIRLPEMHQKPLIGWNDEILGYEPTDYLEYPERARYIRNGPRPQLLGTNHYATEAIQVNGSTYARGILYHRPDRREADHRNIRLGKVWGKIFRNTALGSWSAAGGYGRVD
jgi:hypothetical protein